MKKVEEFINKLKKDGRFSAIDFDNLPEDLQINQRYIEEKNQDRVPKIDLLKDVTFNAFKHDLNVLSCTFHPENLTKYICKCIVPSDLLLADYLEADTECIAIISYIRNHIEEKIKDSLTELIEEAYLYDRYRVESRLNSFDDEPFTLSSVVVKERLIKPFQEKIYKRLFVKKQGGSKKKFNIKHPFELEQLVVHYIHLKKEFVRLKADLDQSENNIKWEEKLNKNKANLHDFNLGMFMLAGTDEIIPGYIACDLLIKERHYKKVKPDSLYRMLEAEIKSIPWLAMEKDRINQSKK